MQGLAWLVRMYAEGTCSDYRYTYEHHSPTVGLLRAALQAPAPCTGLPQTAQGSASASAASGARAGPCGDPCGLEPGPQRGAPAGSSAAARAEAKGREGVEIRALAGFASAAGEAGEADGSGARERAGQGLLGGRVGPAAPHGGLGQPARSEWRPLVPVACALALLPGGKTGQMQAPRVRAPGTDLYTFLGGHRFRVTCFIRRSHAGDAAVLLPSMRAHIRGLVGFIGLVGWISSAAWRMRAVDTHGCIGKAQAPSVRAQFRTLQELVRVHGELCRCSHARLPALLPGRSGEGHAPSMRVQVRAWRGLDMPGVCWPQAFAS